MIDKDDWRLRGQEEYLMHKTFAFETYSETQNSKHEHCEFCWHKFMENCEGVEDCSEAGYCTLDHKYWVCEECYEDFKNNFKWIIAE